MHQLNCRNTPVFKLWYNSVFQTVCGLKGGSLAAPTSCLIMCPSHPVSYEKNGQQRRDGWEQYGWARVAVQKQVTPCCYWVCKKQNDEALSHNIVSLCLIFSPHDSCAFYLSVTEQRATAIKDRVWQEGPEALRSFSYVLKRMET